MNALVIATTAIRQDEEGRFSLNDLHRAAGGERRHQPSDWVRLQQTQDRQVRSRGDVHFSISRTY